ncbi:MAG: succinate dehydrogenase assembly factor 2 [Alphaproteobacteria bacterium]|nr:succinate dehydrogenase assembly factor 2 [Alphaproteobacteria bacterium]
MNTSSNSDEVRRKRLLWRATHRGMKEMDIIFGEFVARRLPGFSEAELDQLEAIIALSDQELLSWATRQSPVPDDLASPLLLEMLASRA